jgi:hypothetical protein
MAHCSSLAVINSFADLQGGPVRLVSSVLDQPNDVRIKRRARALLQILTGVAVAAAVLSFSGSVVAQTDMEKQAQCELSAIRDTRSALAVQYIRSACNWLVVNGDSLLNASSKGYYVCLVRQLSGAQSNEAAAAIMSACRASNPL